MFKRGVRLFYQFFGQLKWTLFVCFLFLSVIPATITGYLLFDRSYNAIEEKVGVYSQQIMLQSVGRLDGFLTGIEDIALQIVSSTDIQALIKDIAIAEDVTVEASKTEALRRRLVQILSSKREVIGVQVLLKDRDLAITSGDKIVLGDYKSSAEYTHAMNLVGEVYWRGTIENQSPSILYQYITPFSRKIYDTESGNVMGTLVLAIKEFALADTFSYIDLGPNGFVFIMDQDTNIVSHLSKRKLTKPAEYSFVKSIVQAAEDDSRMFPAYVDNEKFLISYSKSNVTGWYVISAIPYSYLMEGITKVGKYSVQLVVVLFLLALVISLFISIGISRPLRRLVIAMKRVEEGDLQVSVNKLRSSNEVNALGKSFNRMIRRIKLLIDRVYEAEILQKEAEIKALQSQINPHFLYNTLSTIDSIATVKQEHEISAIAQMLADIFRYSTSGNDSATIEEEVNQINRYLNIQKFRYGESLRWQLIVDPTVKGNTIVKILLQPIVENAVLHGIQKEGTIKVIVLPKGNHISITVEDNGVGMNDSVLQQLLQRLENAHNSRIKAEGGDHIGLANVNNRIKSFYGEAFGLKIISALGFGTKVIILIPKRENVSSDGRITK